MFLYVLFCFGNSADPIRSNRLIKCSSMLHCCLFRQYVADENGLFVCHQ